MFNLTKTLFSFLNTRDKRFLFALFFMITATAIIELLGIGSLFPYIKILGDPEIIHKNNILNSIYQGLHFSSHDRFFIFVGVAIFVMILFKGVMSCVNNYYQSRFTCQINNRLAGFCLKSYMRMPYGEAINANSAVLSKHLLLDVTSVSAVFSSILTLLTDVAVAVALTSLMVWVDPLLVFFVIVVLCLFLWLSLNVTKEKIKNLAKENEESNRHAYKTASEALLGIKDVKVYRVENYFVRRYLKWQNRLSTQLVDFNLFSNLPAISMNVIGFGILLVILLYLVVTRGNLIALLPTIGLIAVCVQRLLPSANRISSSVAVVRRYKPVVYIVRKIIDDLLVINAKVRTRVEKESKITFQHRLSLKDVYYRYPHSDRYVLSGVSLDIKKNTALGIVGESGAGKSTLVDVLLGLLPIEKGQIWCDEKDITRYENMALAELVGYVPQQTFLLDGSIKENVAFGIEEYDIDLVALNKAVRVAQLEAFISELPQGIETHIGENGVKLSGGQRQRIGIARALYKDPEILIMDEATNALDSATEREFNESLSHLMREKTIIIVAHRLSSVKNCEILIQLERGKIVSQGTYDELARHSDKFRHIYNVSEEAW